MMTKNTSPDIYRIINNNETTIGEVIEMRRTHGFGLPIKSIIPIISMGRQHGHSTTIRLFIEHNPHINFGIIPSNQSEFINHYKDLSNAHYIIKRNIKNGEYGKVKSFHYIIIDSILYHNDVYIDDVIFSMSSDRYKSAKVIGVGC